MWAPTSDRIAFVSAVYPDCGERRVQCGEGQSRVGEQGEGARRRPAAVSPLERVGRRHALASVRRRHRRQRAEGSDARRASTTFRPDRSAAARATRGRPTVASSSYTAKDQGRADAWTTDLNLYTVPAAGGTPTVITAANKGADQNPVYSPDGKFIAYASQARAGFESDRWRLMLYNRADKTSRELLPDMGPQRRRIPLGARHEQHSRRDDRCVPRQAVSRRARRRHAQGIGAAARDRRSQQHGILPRARRTHRRVSARCDRSARRGVDRRPDGTSTRRGSRAHARKRRGDLEARAESRRGFLVHRRERREGAGTSGQAAQLAGGQEVSGDSAHSRRPAGRVARQLARALELPDVRGHRRGARDHQSARLDGLRSEVRRRRVEGLGRQGLYGFDERPRRRARQVHRGSIATRSARPVDRSAATW